jgi:hypothetical protein
MSNAGSYPFIYEPINPYNMSGIWTRILVIEPAGYWDEPISCVLRPLEIIEPNHDDQTPDDESFWLEGDPRTSRISCYSALSYVWGDATVTKEIVVNGQNLKVTTNLESALRHLRKLDRALVLWADAICINQNDTAERNSHVLLMGKIYKSAAKVTIWLGDGER